jgi:hypothetical protein
MTDAVQPLTAKAKLALSRAELVAAMGYEALESATDGAPAVAPLPKPERHSAAASIAAKVSRSVVGQWWHRHPLNSVVQLGQPFLESYADKHPGKLIAYGAGTGALLWVLKPWKLLSAATVVTLVLRSSNIAGMVAGAVASANRPRDPRT